MASLREMWEAQYDNTENRQLTKEAAAHGLSPDKYLEKLAELKIAQEEQQMKVAQDRFVYGQIVGDGIKYGIKATLSKMAAAGGDAHAAKKLAQLFCEE